MSGNNPALCGILDEILRRREISGSAIRVLLYIVRRCYDQNFQESVCIITDEFLEGASVSRQTLSDSIQSLLNNGIIQRSIAKGRTYKYNVTIETISNNVAEKKKMTKEPAEAQAKTRKKRGKNKNGYGAWGENRKQDIERYRGVDVLEWNYDHISLYMIALVKYHAKHAKVALKGKPIHFGRGVKTSGNINRCKGFLIEYSGEDNWKFIIKAYIEWFMKNYSMRVLKETGKLSTENMVQISRLKDFVKEYGLTKGMSEKNLFKKLDFCRRVCPEKKAKVVKTIDKKIMDENYGLGISSLLSECGIVLAANYLIKYKNKTFTEVAKEIHSYLKEINVSHERQKKSLIGIIDATCHKSPYSEKMVMLDWSKRFGDVFSQLNGEFSMDGYKITQNNGQYSFLIAEETVVK